MCQTVATSMINKAELNIDQKQLREGKGYIGLHCQVTGQELNPELEVETTEWHSLLTFLSSSYLSTFCIQPDTTCLAMGPSTVERVRLYLSLIVTSISYRHTQRTLWPKGLLSWGFSSQMTLGCVKLTVNFKLKLTWTRVRELRRYRACVCMNMGTGLS